MYLRSFFWLVVFYTTYVKCFYTGHNGHSKIPYLTPLYTSVDNIPDNIHDNIPDNIPDNIRDNVYMNLDYAFRNDPFGLNIKDVVLGDIFMNDEEQWKAKVNFMVGDIHMFIFVNGKGLVVHQDDLLYFYEEDAQLEYTKTFYIYGKYQGKYCLQRHITEFPIYAW